MTSSSVPGFRPSIQGLHFSNSWPDEPDLVVDVAPFGQISIGDAANGLCGGMVFTVADFFRAALPVPADTTTPAQGTALFTYIVGRLFDSFDIPSGVLQYLNWMATPDHDTGISWLAIRRGVAWLTISDEWPQIKAAIDAGQLCPLGLVTVYSVNPADLGDNHVVLAYAYDLNGDDLTVHVYDPDTDPNTADGAQLSLNLANPSHTTPISHNLGIGRPIRGFFHIPYDAHDPRTLEPPAPPPPPPAMLHITVTPNPVPTGTPAAVTVHAVDSQTGATVAGSVSINTTPVGVTDTPFTYTFRPTFGRQPFMAPTGGHEPPPPFPPRRPIWPSGRVTAPGYPTAYIDFGLPADTVD